MVLSLIQTLKINIKLKILSYLPEMFYSNLKTFFLFILICYKLNSYIFLGEINKYLNIILRITWVPTSEFIH